eukprot:2506391-Amphidinium_carterae.1
MSQSRNTCEDRFETLQGCCQVVSGQKRCTCNWPNHALRLVDNALESNRLCLREVAQHFSIQVHLQGVHTFCAHTHPSQSHPHSLRHVHCASSCPFICPLKPAWMRDAKVNLRPFQPSNQETVYQTMLSRGRVDARNPQCPCTRAANRVSGENRQTPQNKPRKNRLYLMLERPYLMLTH